MRLIWSPDADGAVISSSSKSTDKLEIPFIPQKTFLPWRRAPCLFVSSSIKPIIAKLESGDVRISLAILSPVLPAPINSNLFFV